MRACDLLGKIRVIGVGDSGGNPVAINIRLDCPELSLGEEGGYIKQLG